MKFASSLTTEQHEQLQDLMKNSPTHRIRQRAHAVVLSAKRYSVEQIADIFEVDRDTISLWLDNWSASGVDGLADAAKSGRPQTVDVRTAEKLVTQVQASPRQITQTLSALKKTGHNDQP
jgi:transposase